MRTFEGVDEDGRTELGNDGIADFTADSILITVGHLGPGSIGDVAEVGTSPAFILGAIGAQFSLGICFASTAKIVGIREEGVAVLVPDKRSEFILLQSVRRLRNEFHLVALVRKVLPFGVRLVDLGREPVEVAGDTRRPEPFLGRVHHQVPETFRTCRRGGRLHDAMAAFLLRGLAHLVDVNALSRNQEVAIRVVHDTVGTRHTVAGGTKSFLAEQLQITRTIIIIVQVLHAVILTILGIVQRSLRGSVRHDIAHLLNPDTDRRVLRRRHIARSHGKSTAQRYGQ